MRILDAERGLSGVVRITRGGAVELEGCYGLADRAAGTPVRPGTRFGIASMTKMLTAVAVAQLVADGRLSFETPAIDVLPPERRPSTLRADVTVHHLLTHTSGIADYFEEETAEEMAEYAALWEGRPSYRMLRPADFLPLFGDLPPYRPPGQRFQYSNAGYIVLGLVIEEITGEAYTDVVEQRVLAAAGMHDSGFFALDEVRPDVAVGYLPPREEDGPWRTNVYAIPIVGGPDGGAFASAPDLDCFLTAYDDGALLSPPLRDAMVTVYETTADGVGVGRGVFLHGEGRRRRFGHGGGDPGVEGFLFRYPDLDVNAVILCNVNNLASNVRGLVVQALEATA